MLKESHELRLAALELQAQPLDDGQIGPAYLMAQLRQTCPRNTTWVVEAVTSAVIAAEQLRPTEPVSWINCGGGGLGWSGGGALGVRLALEG